MATVKKGLITETNRQYYEGSQSITAKTGGQSAFVFTGFNTPLIWYSSDPDNDNYQLNNFKVYRSTNNGRDFLETDYYTLIGENTIATIDAENAGTIILVQLKRLEGGKYGNNNAYGTVVEENYGSYSYIKLYDIIL